MSEKTEQPTARRRRDAEKKGQFPRSRMGAAGFAGIGGLLGAISGLRSGAGELQALAVRLWGLSRPTPAGAIVDAVQVMARVCAPALVGAVLGATLGVIVTSGVRFSPAQLGLKLDRLSPAKGLQQLFSLQRVGEVGRGLLVLILVLTVVSAAAWGALPALIRIGRLSGIGGALLALDWARSIAVRAAVVFAIAGAVDIALARRRHLKSLMMTREEVKREHKESEGDPHHKSKRKALHRAMAQGGPARGLHKATAVVVNPTHIAVALRYDESECEAPYLVAKAREEDALALRRQAKALGIPVVKDIPLARSLIHFDVGEEIPEELYRAAAAVIKVALASRDADPHPRSRTA